jgi:DnaJ-class molecular chaperone
MRRRSRPEPLIPEPVSMFDDFETYRPSFEELRQRWLRNFTRADTPKGERIEALNLEIVLSREDAARGGELPLGVPVFRPCGSCLGTGRSWLSECPACDGHGVVQQELVGRIPIPAGLRDGTIIDVPVHGLGVHNFHLRLHVRVSGGH